MAVGKPVYLAPRNHSKRMVSFVKLLKPMNDQRIHKLRILSRTSSRSLQNQVQKNTGAANDVHYSTLASFN